MKLKIFNVLTDGKRFFDLPVKNEEEAYEKIIEMSKNNDYATGNLLDFIGKLENQDHGATMFFIIKKSEKTTFNFSQNSVTII